jgi:hypothetical protein
MEYLIMWLPREKHIWVLALVVLLSVSACRSGAPWKSWMYDGPPDADKRAYPPLYVQGWKDGCESGVSAQTTLYYKFQHHFRQDWQLAQNEVYYKGWKDAFDYCQKYTNQYYSSEFL